MPKFRVGGKKGQKKRPDGWKMQRWYEMRLERQMGRTIIYEYNGEPAGVRSSKVIRSDFHFEKTILATEVSEMPRKKKAGQTGKEEGKSRSSTCNSAASISTGSL